MDGCLNVVRSGLMLLIGGAVAVALVAMFWFAGRPDVQGASAANAGVTKQGEVVDVAALRARMDAGVFEPYDRSKYPRLSEELGERWEAIQPMREAAALKALQTRGCRRVEVSEVSVERSTKNSLRAFVYCDESLERHDFSEADLRE